MCGCSSFAHTCSYCDSTYFIGYDTLYAANNDYVLFPNASSSGAPNSSGKNCSTNTEDVDVRKISNDRLFFFQKLFE